MSFELDLWGKLRSATEAARAQLLATEEAKRTVILTLVSQLANSYVRLLDFDQQLTITHATLETRQESVRINRLRFQAGLTSELEYQQAVAEYQNAAVQVPLLERLIAQQENAISLLLGRNPGKISRGVTLEQLALPQVPGGLPSDLLERRPDIRQAEQELIAANALIGVAKAAFFPSISLTGFFGTASTDLSDLFKGPSRTWQFAGQLLQPIFTGGALTGQLQVAEAVQKQALLNYQQMIQNAFAEVDDNLIAVSKLREQLKDPGGAAQRPATLPGSGDAALQERLYRLPDGGGRRTQSVHRATTVCAEPGRSVRGPGQSVQGAGRRLGERGGADERAAGEGGRFGTTELAIVSFANQKGAFSRALFFMTDA